MPTIPTSVGNPRSPLFTTADALASGYARDDVRRFVSRQEWIRLRRGAYTTADAWADADEATRHLMRCTAIQRCASQPIAASHWSAALAQGLPLLRPIPDLPHVTANREHFRTLPDARLFNGALHPGHTQRVGDTLVTTPARTISDIARTRAVAEALVMFEHGLREGLVTRDDMVGIVRRCPTWRGIAWTKRVLEWAEPRNETVGESLSLYRVRERGLPLPDCQVDIVVDGCRYRLDFLWRDRGLAGEFDGRGKYSDPSVLWAEKRREDALRSVGLAVARWGWEDVRKDGAPLERILRRAFATAEAGHDRTWRSLVAEPGR